MGQQQEGGLTGQRLGEFELHDLLGAGGMAEVYRARDLALNREVAVKVLPSTLAADQAYVDRFRDEARRVGALTHQHIVRVYYSGEERGLLYLVMPVLQQSLRDRLDREHVLAPEEAARLAVQVASALDAAHRVGIVHRDVKPENILLDDEGKALLTDFGIAREISFLQQTGAARTLAATGLPVGTPEYMAPEQMRGGMVDQRVDIYALGAVLYEMLTGRVPHDADSPYQVAALTLTEPVTPPSVHNSAIWPELEAVVMAALANDPDTRYPDARSFALDLRRAVLETAREARPATPRPLTARLSGGAGVGTALTVARGRTALVAQWAPATTLPPLSVEARPARRRTLFSILALAVLAAAVLGSSIALLGSGGDKPFLFGRAADPSGVGRGSATAGSGIGAAAATATAAATAQVGGLPGSTPGIVPTQTSVPAPATATPVAPTAVPGTPGPSALTLSPTSPNVSRVSGGCQGKQTINNPTGSRLGWRWSSVSPPLPSGFRYSLNGSGFVSGMPSNPGLDAGNSDSLTFFLPCTDTRYTVTITDTLGNVATFTFRVPD